MTRLSSTLLLLLLISPLLARPTLEKDPLVPVPWPGKIRSCDYYCMALWDPVCTQLGETYSNRCFMSLASCWDGVERHVVHKGRCGENEDM